MISRDIKFDELTLEFTMDRPSEEDDNGALDLDLLETKNEDVRRVTHKQIGKRKNQP